MIVLLFFESFAGSLLSDWWLSPPAPCSSLENTGITIMLWLHSRSLRLCATKLFTMQVRTFCRISMYVAQEKVGDTGVSRRDPSGTCVDLHAVSIARRTPE